MSKKHNEITPQKIKLELSELEDISKEFELLDIEPKKEKEEKLTDQHYYNQHNLPTPVTIEIKKEEKKEKAETPEEVALYERQEDHDAEPYVFNTVLGNIRQMLGTPAETKQEKQETTEEELAEINNIIAQQSYFDMLLDFQEQSKVTEDNYDEDDAIDKLLYGGKSINEVLYGDVTRESIMEHVFESKVYGESEKETIIALVCSGL